MTRGHRSGLLVVDVQNDFCAGGTLAVPNADRVVSALNRYIGQAVGEGMTVYASRDWHPPRSTHFKPYGGPWPVHCVRDTEGARFHPDIRLPPTAIVVTKGESPTSPGYSAFEGRTPDGTPLAAELRRRGIDRLYIGGLATDYCVRQSVLDGLAAGLRVAVLVDAIAGVDPDGSTSAIVEMRRQGACVGAGLQGLDDPSAPSERP
jgi:nicotinamidase/pyrazinamidase